jgi:hypothetical protein
MAARDNRADPFGMTNRRTDAVKVYIPTHRKERDEWGTRSFLAGSRTTAKARENAGILRYTQDDDVKTGARLE